MARRPSYPSKAAKCSRRPRLLLAILFPRVETQEVRRLTRDDEADERQPWFSPDGRRVAYARYRWYPGQPFYEASEIMAVEVPY